MENYQTLSIRIGRLFVHRSPSTHAPGTYTVRARGHLGRDRLRCVDGTLGCSGNEGFGTRASGFRSDGEYD
jgi:hypothetical protein